MRDDAVGDEVVRALDLDVVDRLWRQRLDGDDAIPGDIRRVPMLYVT